MNKPTRHPSRITSPMLAAAVTALLLGGCASAPVSPPGAADVRAKLGQLQADPNLASRAPVAIREAETAVRIAEEPVGSDAALGAHRVLMADRKVEIARARAQTRYAEDQRARLSEERASTRLDARTREADQARDSADAARAQAAATTAAASLEAAELRRQIEALEARETERGLVLTLGDVLFETARSDLKAGATANLTKLANFLNQYPDRNVVIEGHTDNVGSAEYNQALSERRADAVKSWLMQQGISSQRMVASGKGLHQPVADNSSATGRQLNRRVEVIIENNPVASSR
jgi:outer membrane protein OmpA-like peptidoglycan-associated protein